MPKQICHHINLQIKVTNEQEIMKALHTIEQKAKKLDILVNCAGIFLAEDTFNYENRTPHPLKSFENVLQVLSLFIDINMK